ncbi:MAG TPA: sigma-70 family RNA polymerase sigma factor [Baekduia sp.]|uniref:sigma-70 family RNA polymerase sigma factor n=1 Tax=Baekduia sp. TaxID=2600305 RepID=UPI002CE05005|nr:sigma-70 family RNA polymerase sigma factor [Baekduia sp.]HMJ34905.1 sigma-70 family RNA polymerase sigma factor [Baekduia sp.]
MLQPTPQSEFDAASFDALRPKLFGIAYRVLGSTTDADDVVQDAWIRWVHADRGEIRDVPAFLATITTRLAINVVQSARRRHEIPTGAGQPEPVDHDADPALAAERTEVLDLAARMLLEHLSPTERAAYVLREAFGYPYRQIAKVLALSEANARQLVTRARARVAGDQRYRADASDRAELIDAIASASDTGNLMALERQLLQRSRSSTTRSSRTQRLPLAATG